MPEQSGFAGKGRVMDVAYPYFSKAFDIISHNICIDKQVK